MIQDRPRAEEERQRQIREADELLFSGPQALGVAKGLFQGRFVADWVMPYSHLRPDERETLDALLPELREFLDERLHPERIDREADIPPETIREMGRLGLLGMTVPREYGGRGFSLSLYCRVMEEIGARCASTSVFINAHHSIGSRALLLFGTPEQKQRWLPGLADGTRLAAFALTEPEAGSDAANVQSLAVPVPGGWVLNGQKRFITNGAIADALTVIARTPLPGSEETGISAFLVTPDMPGFTVVEPRMDKLGIRGTATATLEFHSVPIPAENRIGPEGKGLRVALTVLDFGRTTFGACCTGAARTALRLAASHARQRRQFGRALAEFELVKQKLARMAASLYAMEAMTAVTASLIDRGLQDYMLETAMLKVFTTEALWEAVHESFQVHGGPAYFRDLPLERMLRDARINQIGEGANEVLLSFIALVGMRGPGQQLQELWEGLHRWSLDRAWKIGSAHLGAAVVPPPIPVTAAALRPFAHRLGLAIRRFQRSVDGVLIRYREEVLERQYLQERIARAAIELFAQGCVLSRLDAELVPRDGPLPPAPELFLRQSARRVDAHLTALSDHDDPLVTAAADAALERG